MDKNQVDRLLDFCINFIGDKENVSDIYLRYKGSTFLSYIYGDKNYIHFANNEKCKSQMLMSCIDLFIEIERFQFGQPILFSFKIRT